MKGRESGMPEETYWESFFDAARVLEALVGSQPIVGDVVEFGCGYGTFTLAQAAHTTGTVTTLDIDPLMVARTRERAASQRLENVVVSERDFIAHGTGLPDGSQELALVFNLLHIEDPLALLAEAHRVLHVGSRLAVIHWRSDIPTPRGPSLDVRPTPGQCAAWMAHAGFGDIHSVDVTSGSPFHFGLVARRRGTDES